MTPDLIICDINLKTSTMNGFVLYEKVQAHKNLQNIPFIFLTGLMDEKLAWTGKELGADDYLLKPVSRNTLLSTLHGKLKRFRQLRNSSSPQNSAFC
jgi:DNA-binding response OmpR family regulator